MITRMIVMIHKNDDNANNSDDNEDNSSHNNDDNTVDNQGSQHNSTNDNSSFAGWARRLDGQPLGLKTSS